MQCATADRRFSVQQIDDRRWREATEANLAADFLAGYEPWTTAFTDSRADWHAFGEFLRSSSADDLSAFVEKRKGASLAFLVMMLTGACNADCPICFTDRRRKRGEMTPALRDRVIHEAASLGARYVYVPGEGEPTIDRGWWDFLESCRSAGLHAVVFTNGLIFSDPMTSRKYWDCEPAEAVARLAGYPVSLYVKMWSTRPELVGEMMAIDPAKYRFAEYDRCMVPAGMVTLLETLPRERLGVEVVVERRNADEVAGTIVPFADRHGLSSIVEIIQHNGRIFGDNRYDPTPAQQEAVQRFLSPTSCSVATCKAVVTTQGYLSPRIAILESQLTAPRQVNEGPLWELLHHTDYLVQRRYELNCLCESEPAALAGAAAGTLAGPTSVVPPQLARSAAGQVAAQPAAAAAADGQMAAQPVAAAAADAETGPAVAGPLRAVGELARGEARHGEQIALAGRALTRGPGLFELADGPATVTVAGLDAPSYAWVHVTGTWDAIARAVRAETVRALKLPATAPAGNLAVEFGPVRDPQLLAPVLTRSQLAANWRDSLRERGYIEVTTPMLQAAAEMCQVSQVRTEPVRGRRFHLRTDPEEYLKRYLSAGLAAVFEISTNVRADPADEWHLTEFQSLEYYRRLMTFTDTLATADELVRAGLAEAGGKCPVWNGMVIDTLRPFPQVTFDELFASVLGVDLAGPGCASAKGLAAALESAGYPVTVGEPLASWRRAWLEAALEEHVLPKLRQPLWVTHFPVDLGLSARTDPREPRNALRAELYLGELELAHVYENLTDGAELRARYDVRRSHRVASGLSYVPTNEPLMRSADSAMPPMAGGAIGLDRVLMVGLGEELVGSGLLFGREGSPLAQVRPGASLCGAAAGASGCAAGGCGSCQGGCH